MKGLRQKFKKEMTRVLRVPAWVPNVYWVLGRDRTYDDIFLYLVEENHWLEHYL